MKELGLNVLERCHTANLPYRMREKHIENFHYVLIQNKISLINSYRDINSDAVTLDDFMYYIRFSLAIS